MNTTEIVSRRRTADAAQREVVGVKARKCGETAHASILHFKDETTMTDGDAIALLDAGGTLVMIPPPGAQAHADHVETGLPLLLQHRYCDDCQCEVLWA